MHLLEAPRKDIGLQIQAPSKGALRHCAGAYGVLTRSNGHDARVPLPISICSSAPWKGHKSFYERPIHNRKATKTGHEINALAWPSLSSEWVEQRTAALMAVSGETVCCVASLRRFYPGSLAAFEDLAGRDALAVLPLTTTPDAAQRLMTGRARAALYRIGRCHPPA